MDNEAILENIFESVMEEFPDITPKEAEEIAREIFLSVSKGVE
tara:strand:+ start:336 stop:464 length:129 start_codon:yes stop_codon:yes gene_type:complete